MFRNTLRHIHKICNATSVRPAFITQHRFYSVDSAAAQGSFLEKDAVVERVVNVVKKHEKVDPSKVSPNSHFVNDLSLDSLDSTEVVMEIENEFAVDIPDEEAFKMQSVDDVVSYILKNPMANHTTTAGGVFSSPQTPTSALNVVPTTEHIHYILYFPRNYERGVSLVGRYRLGLEERGLENLQKADFEMEEKVEIKDKHFIDEFYDKQAMVDDNRWVKKRIFTNETRERLEHLPELSIEKSNVQVRGSDSEVIEYSQTGQTWTEYSQQWTRAATSDPIAVIFVHRLEFIGKRFKIFVDRVTFPDQDPHCSCAVECNIHIPALERVFRDNALNPVRSKITEYLYRYDRKTYESLIARGRIPDIPYQKSYLQDQWNKVEKLPLDQFYNVLDRTMGMADAPVTECTDETVEEFLKIIEEDNV